MKYKKSDSLNGITLNLSCICDILFRIILISINDEKFSIKTLYFFVET